MGRGAIRTGVPRRKGKLKMFKNEGSNYCVMCGAEIPEGMQVCLNCLYNAGVEDDLDSYSVFCSNGGA